MKSLKNQIWRARTADGAADLDRLARPASIDALRDAIFAARGVANPEKFCRADWSEIPAPERLAALPEARDRILRAIDSGEKIFIFGDYDVDGCTAATLLSEALKRAGATVETRLPHREFDGYGLSEKIVREAIDSRAKVLITVDCGTTNLAEIATARAAGLDAIVVDHHTPLSAGKNGENSEQKNSPGIKNLSLPDAIILNPKAHDSDSPDRILSAGALAWELGRAVLAAARGPADAEHFGKWGLDLVALSTVCDCAPLYGANRTLTRLGLEVLRFARRPGIAALFKISNADPRTVRASDLGFRLGPKINAAGRLESINQAFALLAAGDEKTALEIAGGLKQLNGTRQNLVAENLAEAEAALGPVTDRTKILIATGAWRAGVVGLLAGKLCEKYHRPVIIAEKRGDQVVGSCRSIPSFSVVEMLDQASKYFTRYGGHSQAGGFSAPVKNWPKIQEILKKTAERLGPDDFRAELLLDAELAPNLVSLDAADAAEMLEPTGTGNPPPVFLLRGVVEEFRPVGDQKTHAQVKLRGIPRRAIFFSGAEFGKKLAPGSGAEFAVQISRGSWQNRPTLELEIRDARVIKK